MTESAPARPTTLAVVVTCGVTSYLPTTLAALAAQDHLPESVLVVDISAPDREIETGIPLHHAIEESGLDVATRVRVVGAPEARTFGEAVTAGIEKYAALLARAERRGRGHEGMTGPRTAHALSTGWRTGEMAPITTGEMRAVGLAERPHSRAAYLWLLHDDSAPAPAALDHLLHAAESGPSVAVAGAKQRDWARPERLLQVGVRATRSARRVEEVEPDEIDQGQHDAREDVLAVGLAGALVRRDVWEQLGGTDPALGPFGDGVDLCRRARLAGHRVIVVPSAWVHHARAGYLGLRGAQGDQVPDERRSYLARRRAQLYNWLKAVPALVLPFALLAMLALAPLRALGRVATKEIPLVGAEIGAVLAVLGQLGPLLRARRQARATSTLPRRALRPLEADAREIRRIRRDRRRQVAAARRAAEAPSELEMAEKAALARRRRLTLAAVGVVLVVLTLIAYAHLLAGGALTGGALRPAASGLGGLWEAARSGWVADGLGHAGPADPLLTVLAVLLTPLAVFGGTADLLVGILLLGGIPLAGLGAWFAAGAATRSVFLRGWAALAWALTPALLVGVGQGRLGAVLAHVALPWVVLGVARGLGYARRDVILSGMVGAQRVIPAAVVTGPEPQNEAPARPEAIDASAPVDAESAGSTEAAPDGDGPVGTKPAPDGDGVGTGPAPDGDGRGSTEAAPDGESAKADAAAEPTEDAPPPVATIAPPAFHRASLAAAAAAGLALAVATAGAPVLLPAAIVILLVLGLVVRRHRRRLVVVALPALVLHGPVLTAALADPNVGWRVLLADPGAPYAYAPAPAWQQLAGWPVARPADLAEPLTLPPLAGGAVLVLLALLALLRTGSRARAVRVGWLLAAVGLLLAGLSARADVAIGPDATGADHLVRGWTGPGIAVVAAGLLLAVLVGADGLRSSIAAASFGWRQLSSAVLSLVMVAALVLTAGVWLTGTRQSTDRPTEWLAITGRSVNPVPALGAELQQGSQRSRVLALHATGDGVEAQLWRGAGELLTEASTVVSARQLTGPLGAAEPATRDEAEAALAAAVAAISAGATTSAGEALGQFGVGVVVAPPLPTYVAEGAELDRGDRERLIAQLDATAGLERVTQNATGVIWRVSTDPAVTGSAGSVARARIVDGRGGVLADVAAGPVGIDTRIEPGERGRTLVLAERADTGWRASVDGRPLRAVADGWRQAFALPENGGRLIVSYEPAWLRPWDVAQIVVIGLTALLALPLRRRRLEVGP